jgi:hypothetical protein
MNEEQALEFGANWIAGKKRSDRLPSAREDDTPDLAPHVLVVKESTPLHTKRFRSTDTVYHIYDGAFVQRPEKRADFDEYCKLWRQFVDVLVCLRGTNVYAAKNDVKRAEARNTRIDTLKTEITELEKNRSAIESELKDSQQKLNDLKKEKEVAKDNELLELRIKLQNQEETVRVNKEKLRSFRSEMYALQSELDEQSLNAKTGPSLDDLKKRKADLRDLWKTATRVIDALLENRYVQGRNHNDAANLREYKYALYAMLME